MCSNSILGKRIPQRATWFTLLPGTGLELHWLALSSLLCSGQWLMSEVRVQWLTPEVRVQWLTPEVQVQAGVNDSSLPEALANICNDLWLGAQVCQGFILDSDTGIASFLYQQHYAYINLTQQAAVCNRPDSSMWLLKGGKGCCILDR